VDGQPAGHRSHVGALLVVRGGAVITAERNVAQSRDDRWPQVDSAALHGLPGSFVNALDPHTEADPVAVLIQFLAAFGNCIGRGPHFVAEADKHYTNLFAVLVGETSKARKGSSWGHVHRLYQEVDAGWATKRVAEGLSSGEGLIWQVRDSITRMEKGEEVLADPGVEDKRLFLVESEYVAVFKVMARQGNTLSPIIRRAWDGGHLEALTKNSPARATDAHVSIIGHITTHELRRHLTATEAASGFGNRHLYCCVRRSKCLPEGGQWTKDDLAPFSEDLRAAIEFARSLGEFEIQRDEQSGKIWRTIYPDLSEGKPGMVGAMTARAEAQVMRLALLYALLDRSQQIATDHLLAALALWQYCEDSVRYVFGSTVGDPTCDAILGALEDAGELTRTQIRDLFGRHVPGAEIDRALGVLRKLGRVEVRRERTGGRPTETWRLKDERR
jgi:Protein of unknown function (DUF3987)